MSAWHEGTIADLADIIMGQSPPGESCSSDNIGLPLLNGPTEFGLVHPVAVQYTADSKREAKRNDILFCVRGSTTGRMNWADQPYSIGRGLAAIRHKKGEKYHHYLKGIIDYYLPHLLTAATGSTFPNVSKDQILGLKVMLPSLTEQEAIADMLASISDKIELNQRMNETLAAIARALFKSWFVNFDPVRAKAEGRKPEGMDAATAALFPAAFNDDGLPEGWATRKLSELTSDLRRGVSPKYLDSGGIRVINQKCIRDGVVSFSPSRRHDHISKSVEGREIKNGDILINSTGVGTLGRVAQVWALKEPTIADSHVTIVRGEKTKITPIYLGQNLLMRQSEIEELGEGSTGQTELSRARLGNLDLVVPPLTLLNKFEDILRSSIDKISCNQDESISLSDMRDAVLPKLISGELRIGDAGSVRKKAAG